MATVVATFVIQRYRFTAIPPSGAAMMLGILAGIAIKLTGDELTQPLAVQFVLHVCEVGSAHLKMSVHTSYQAGSLICR